MLNLRSSRFIHSLRIFARARLSRVIVSVIIDAKWKRGIWGIYVDTGTRPRAHSRFSFLPSTSFIFWIHGSPCFPLPQPYPLFFFLDCSFTTGLRSLEEL